MEEQLIFDIWETFRDHISKENRSAAADQFVDFLVEQDVDAKVLEGLLGYDPSLDESINSVLAEFNDDEVSYEDDEEEEDEDY